MSDNSDTPAPEGYEYVWVPTDELLTELEWVVLDEPDETHRCRGDNSRCPNPPIAKLNRSHTTTPRWWFYCDAHLFGRRIVDGEMQTRVLREIPEATGE